ncbi:MAG TPA: imidazole glycerol phosphate synthase subunit HisH [Steroidobacteraceae bacterium]|nr:imidazole glycerol phosphate synthase subunit HisH [Steroidobacteraceae bacterium]
MGAVSEVVIVDSGGANLASLEYALARLGARTEVTSDPQRVAGAARVILPGVGCAGDAMQRLRASGLAESLPGLTRPVLGICLGMQLLFRHSEEGPADCLGVLHDSVQRLRAAPGRPVPHMGWNQLAIEHSDPLLEGISSGEYVYFVHGFAAPVGEATLATTDYGGPLSAVVRQNNFWGTQFHPERSARTGARVLANFLQLE